MDWAKVLAFIVDLVGLVRSWLARQAGIDAAERKQAEADAEAAKKRAEVEDANSKLTPDQRRDDLSKWVRP